MKVVILAGGLGSRLAEETEVKPKPMIEVGGKPMLWHIMKGYAHHGFNEFVVALGYKGEVIKRYFIDYYHMGSRMTVNLGDGQVSVQDTKSEPWIVHLVDTGQGTQTGGRLLRLKSLLGNERFMLTYGDGVGNIDIQALLHTHQAHGRAATITAVRPPSRFGDLLLEGPLVKAFTEKSQAGDGWINGGFMVFESGVFEFLSSDASVLEVEGLEGLAKRGQLGVYRHDNFWQCMDTLREKRYMESLWSENKAPWKIWA